MLGAQPNHSWQLCFSLLITRQQVGPQYIDGGLGPDVVSVVGPTGVSLLDFFYCGIQLYILLSPYLCFVSFLYFDLYLLGDNTSKS